MKVSRVLAMMLCIMIMANCLVVAAAASVPGFMAKSSYLHREVRHSASAQVGAGEIVRAVAEANETAVATAWGVLGTCRVWWSNNP